MADGKEKRVHVVTGGGSGIGCAVAEMLPKDDAVLITGRHKDKLAQVARELNARGHHIETAACDVSKREDVSALAAFASSFGHIATVVHAAGISGSMGNSEGIVRINALGTVYVNQVLEDEEAFVSALVHRAALVPGKGVAPQIAYMISKNFARWYSGQCALKYMRTRQIRVFSVSPGYVETPMTEKEKGKATDILLGYSGPGRGAAPEELAYLICALADERCGYLMGTDVLCDGGCVTAGYRMSVATDEKKVPAPGGAW